VLLGKSPLDDCQDLRIEPAKSLLHGSGLDTVAIAAEVGCVDGTTLRTHLRQRGQDGDRGKAGDHSWMPNLKERMDEIEIERAAVCARLIKMLKLSGTMIDDTCRRRFVWRSATRGYTRPYQQSPRIIGKA